MIAYLIPDAISWNLEISLSKYTMRRRNDNDTSNEVKDLPVGRRSPTRASHARTFPVQAEQVLESKSRVLESKFDYVPIGIANYADFQAGDSLLVSRETYGANLNLAATKSKFSFTLSALVLAAIVLGVVLRGWFLLHAPVNSDEAIVGLMAKEILRGHFSAFYWGQTYGGGEPYVVAGFFFLFGQSAFILNATAAFLSGVTALVTWRCARHLVKDPWLAALAGALVWAAPEIAVWNSTKEFGFRGLTALCGVGCLLLALRVFDGKRSLGEFLVLGIISGIGWWSSPEIVYFLLPSLLILISSLVSSLVRDTARKNVIWYWLARAGTSALALGVGALPWLWANIYSGFNSLNLHSFPGSNSPRNTGYESRLISFFRDALPMEFGLRNEGTGAWIFASGPFRVPGHLFSNSGDFFPHLLLYALLGITVLVIVVGVGICLARGSKYGAIAVGTIAFAFIYSMSPATWFWNDGRYIVLIGPLLALVLVVCAEEIGSWRTRSYSLHSLKAHSAKRFDSAKRLTYARSVMAIFLIACATLSVISFYQVTSSRIEKLSFIQTGDPNSLTNQAIDTFKKNGIYDAYADYWVAYKMDFLGNLSIKVATFGNDVDRWSSLNKLVTNDPHQAWLFVPPKEIHFGYQQFAQTQSIQGPDGESQSAFEGYLKQHGISYRVIKAGILNAVIPMKPVSARQIGLT